MKQGIFDKVCELPDLAAKGRYDRLLGIDDIKERILKESLLMLDPTSLRSWIDAHHRGASALERSFKERVPLFLFAGDVGTGKTELAETMGDAIARSLGIGATFYSLSLSARGTGAVGEMTSLLAAAFAELHSAGTKGRRKNSRPAHVTILLIDEADALAQSREASQMHHEDRAGVNAIIRGVDDLAEEELPVLVVMCTNRLSAIDPAVRRRAAVTLEFQRPNDIQRRSILERAFDGVGFTAKQLEQLVEATGPQSKTSFGVTFSDLVQRFVPQVILACFPEKPVTFAIAHQLAKDFKPTPPFQENQHS